jgi:ferric-dicitrate binding protein FerR (iron transport regulator)
MSQSALRSAVCCLLAVIFPAQLMLAGETAAAMLYTNGAAWLNGSEVPKSAAVFSGDMLQTRADSTASIQSNGSNVTVMADSLVKFEGPAVELEHGSVRVTTSRGMAARAGDVTVTPAGSAWTEFQVKDVDGRVQIAANKGDVTVQDTQGTTTVTQGQETTRDDTSNPEKKKKKRRKAGAAPAAGGGIMSSTPVVVGALAATGGAAAWIWLGGGGEGPVSPDCPTNPCK